MHKRVLGALLGVCLISGMLAIGAAPAQAARPFGIQQFHPNDTPNFVGPCGGGGPNCRGDLLSDKFDGTDAVAHLTAVATPETDNVTWYACPENFTAAAGTDEPPAPTNAQLASCNVTIGVDSTGVVPPIGPSASSPADEAYDITWDIPGSLDQQRRDIVALACIGSGQNLDNPNPNCRADVEQSIFLEDAQTGVAANQSTAGEMTVYRTAAADPSCGGSPLGSACLANFKPFTHGSPVPNDGFTLRATTSDDVGSLAALVNSPSDAQTEPSGSNDLNGPTCSLLQTATNFKTWECVLGNGDIPDDAEMAINITDISTPASKPEGQGGYCNSENNPTSAPSAQNQVAGAHDGCTLDMHYAVSSARAAANLVQTFEPNPPSPSGTASCASPDTDESSNLNTTEDVRICVFDQFGDPFSAPVTESTSGQGEIEDCGTLTAHDHNGDGTIDDCHGNSAGGTATGITVGNPTGPTGDQVLTSCVDPQNSTTQPPGHGCADATGALVKTLTVHWGTKATEVFLAFNNPAPSNTADPCRTGTTFKRNDVGDHDDLTVCTFDSNGNPVPTDTSAQRLQWTITGAQGEEPTAVRFNPAPPPDETTGTSATAQAGVDAVQEGDNFINVFLLDSNGDVIDAFSVEKQVHRSPITRNIKTNLTAKKGRKFIRGKAKSAESECQSGRQVTLFRRRKGPDDVVGSDNTNQFGRWGVKTGHRRGTYYARVAASQTTDAQTGDTLNCLADQSKDVRRG